MAAMRVGLDTRAAFIDPHRGFGRVTRALADALLELSPGEVVVFVPQGAQVPPRWYRVAAEIVQLRRPRRAAFILDGTAWRWTLARHPVEVLHLPTWGVPPGLAVPVVATFYDAIPLRFPSPPGRWARARARMAIRSLRRATHVHAISEFSRGELLATVPIAADRATAVALGVGAPFSATGAPTGDGYLLFVGGADPHKNLELVLRVLAADDRDELPALVIAGPAAGDQKLRARLQELRLAARVTLSGTPDDASLAALYRGALVTVMPSLSEGFGLPALEAMACGCPVVAARAGALPEVCGEAAVLLDPNDHGAWRETLLALARDPARRRALAGAGVARSAAFTWRRTAEGVRAIYRAALDCPRVRN